MEGNRPQMMAGFVIDASVVCTWVLPDEASSATNALLDQMELTGATAPDLLWHEVRNVLMMSRRRNRMTFDAVTVGMVKVRNLPVYTCVLESDEPILTLSERHGLTAYDAAYLALALEMHLPLATLDKQLRAAATREGVPLLV